MIREHAGFGKGSWILKHVCALLKDDCNFVRIAQGGRVLEDGCPCPALMMTVKKMMSELRDHAVSTANILSPEREIENGNE